jgi:hypothetical protein
MLSSKFFPRPEGAAYRTMLAQQSGASDFSTGKNQFWRENPNDWLAITRLYFWTPLKRQGFYWALCAPIVRFKTIYENR